MKNFIFKSKVKSSDLYKIQIKLDLLLTEQRHQRSDLVHIIKQLEFHLPSTASMDSEHIPEEET